MRQPWLLKSIIFFTTCLFLYSLWHRNVHIDDAWIGEQAFWMSELGFVKSELMRGITQQEIKNLVHHKLFTLNGAMFINIFGYSLWSLKTVSLIWFLIFIYIFYIHLKRIFNKTISIILGIMFVVVHSFMFEFSYVYRPEIMLMVLGYISYNSLFCLIKNHDNYQHKNILIAGVFAGLAAVTHLNGLIFIISGFILLLYYIKIKQAILFGIISSLTLTIYFYDFTSLSDFNLWLYQFSQSPAIIEEPQNIVIQILSKIFDEHQLFFHSPKEISFTILVIFCTIIIYKKIAEVKVIYIYLFLLIISLSLISMHNSSRYTIMYLPYMILICIYGIKYIIENDHHKYSRKILALLIFSFITIHTFYNIQVSTRKHYPEKLRNITLSLFGTDSQKLNIVAPMQFIFNEIKYYNRIQSDLGYMDRVRAGEFNTIKEFLCITQNYDINYIFIDQTFSKFLNISKTSKEITDNDYIIWKELPDYLILKNKTMIEL